MKTILIAMILLIPFTSYAKPVYLKCKVTAANEAAKKRQPQKEYEITLDEETASVVHVEDNYSSRTKALFSSDKVQYKFQTYQDSSLSFYEQYEINRNDLNILVFGAVKFDLALPMQYSDELPAYSGSCSVIKVKERKF